LCPIIPYQLRRALFFIKSSRWPPDLKLNDLWVQERNPGILFLFSQKSQQTNPTPGFPAGSLWREILVYRSFCISLKDLIKMPVIRRPQERNAHPCSPKAAKWKLMPISEP